MPMQFETVSRICAGEARFDGAGSVVLVTGAPDWTSAASAAAWLALFGIPSDGQAGGNLRYITDVDVSFTGTGAFMTASGATPSATDGFPASDESYKHMADMIRAAKFYLPIGVSMYVRAWWGSL